MRCGADARVSVAVFAVIFLEKGNELFDVVCRDRGVSQQYIGRRGRQGNGGKILDRVVRNFGIETRIDDETRADHHDGIAVIGGACSRPHAKVATSTWLIFDIELLTETA